MAPSSPYSPGVRPTARLSSTDSVNTNSSINLKEDLAELADLQRQIHQPSPAPPQSVLRRALEDGSLRLYPGGNGMEYKNEPMEDTKLASVLSMVMDHLDMDPLEHMRKEIQSQCSLLNISPGEFKNQRINVLIQQCKMQLNSIQFCKLIHGMVVISL